MIKNRYVGSLPGPVLRVRRIVHEHDRRRDFGLRVPNVVVDRIRPGADRRRDGPLPRQEGRRSARLADRPVCLVVGLYCQDVRPELERESLAHLVLHAAVVEVSVILSHLSRLELELELEAARVARGRLYVLVYRAELHLEPRPRSRLASQLLWGMV